MDWSLPVAPDGIPREAMGGAKPPPEVSAALLSLGHSPVLWLDQSQVSTPWYTGNPPDLRVECRQGWRSPMRVRSILFWLTLFALAGTGSTGFLCGVASMFRPDLDVLSLRHAHRPRGRVPHGGSGAHAS